MIHEIVRQSDVAIATQTFGNPDNPSVLTIMGAMASMLWWPDDFCEALAAQRFHVIRYDNRDTGLSTRYPPGQPGYGFDDMVRDAVRVLDHFAVEKAHVVGMSMGGMIAQTLALTYPARVASLTAISTSPLGVDTSSLPGTTQAYQAHASAGADVDWSNRAEVLDFMLKDARMLASTAHPFDEEGMRDFIDRDYERSEGFASATNHFMIMDGAPAGSIRDLGMRLLVIHGMSDPIFPVEHGEALAAAVADAKLVRVPGGGHELHRDDWPIIVAAIAAHLRA